MSQELSHVHCYKNHVLTLVWNSLEALAESALETKCAEWMDATTGKILESTETCLCAFH